ncbi:GbsR/MarR family transcriptional regulator [Alkaliphilus sp. B6464]|uniref:GbsR/MarR family transcriptional regulator n=1 Tax=Alkaliphilus sp. B6464 TaxID=2731219 RepID=UPI001BAA1CFA|nr:GbsR/MarR family transcriptional regulator [Alkaliphilus sp. B6464]QUH21483.1 GbsR/MarR family transcriptional regulator [Alkaliphilus sp. B6464]
MTQSDIQIINEIEEIKNEATLTLTKLINLYGLTLSESRLFSIMFLENNPMTLDEMSQSLGMSKTSMSTGVRSLLDAQMVERIWKKGIRKDLYMVEKDLYKTFSNAFIENWHSAIYHNTKTFNEILEQLNILSQTVEDPELQIALSQYSKKIDSIIHFYKWLAEVFKEIQEKIESRQ